MGELIRLPVRPHTIYPSRSWRDNEIYRLQATASVAGILARLVRMTGTRCAGRDLEAIEHGHRLLTALALLDLAPAAVAGREDTISREADRIEEMIRNWQAMLDARRA